MAKEKYDYFESFSEQAAIAVKEAGLLLETMKAFTPETDLMQKVGEAHELEHAGDMINHKTFQYVANDFITPFEREDIIALTQSLDSVIDTIEDVMQSFYMFDIHFIPEAAIELAETIQKSCIALEEATKEFKNFKKPQRLHELIVAVNDLEEEGDRQYIQCMHALCSKRDGDAIKVLVWTTLFARLEKCTDACEHASDVMNTVILKNS